MTAPDRGADLPKADHPPSVPPPRPPLPPAFAWLAREPGPRHLRAALETFGTAEKVGRGSNPEILAWYRAVQATGAGRAYGDWYDDDDKPWCGLWAAEIMRRAGRPIPDRYLAAAAWAEWGQPAATPELAAVLVFDRPGGHHVGLYVAESTGHFWVLGGNQRNRVSIVPLARKRLIAVREPVWKSRPPTIRRVPLDIDVGPVSTNEA